MRLSVPRPSAEFISRVLDSPTWTSAGRTHSRCNTRKEGALFTADIDVFNLTSRVNCLTNVGDLDSPFYSGAVAAKPPRRLQLSDVVSSEVLRRSQGYATDASCEMGFTFVDGEVGT